MDDLPQSRVSNFTNMPDFRFTFGLPVISNTDVNFTTSSSMSDYFEFSPNGTTLIFDVDQVIDKMRKNNYIGIGLRTDLLSVSFRALNSYITFNISTRAESEIRLPKSLFELAWYGNGYFIGETADLSGIGYDLTLYNEYGITATHEFFDKLTVGASLKYLQGLANIHTTAERISLTTDTSTYWLTANTDASINISGPFDIKDFDQMSNFSGKDVAEYFIYKNSGLSFGGGAALKINDKISADINFTDIGFIKWNANVKNYAIENGNFSFRGIKIDTSIVDINLDSMMSSLSDSFFAAFSMTESSNPYISPLRTKMYISGTFKLGDKNRFGALYYNRFQKYANYSSLSLMYHRKFGKWLSAGISYTMDNYWDSRIGAALNLKILGGQAYIMTDDLLSYRFPTTAKQFSIRFGYNVAMKMKDDD